MEDIRLQDIMTTTVATVRMDDSVEIIQEIFRIARFHHLLVLSDKDEVVGVISDRDLLKTLSPFLNTVSEQNKDRKTLEKKAHQIMSRKVIWATPTTTLKGAAMIIINHSISCLPVLTENKVLVGIATWKDILRHYLDHPD